LIFFRCQGLSRKNAYFFAGAAGAALPAGAGMTPVSGPIAPPGPGAGGAPAGGPPAGGAGAFFGMACFMMKNSATKIMIIKIATAAGLLFFCSAIVLIHPLSTKVQDFCDIQLRIY
jgi:hypothetical protein